MERLLSKPRPSISFKAWIPTVWLCWSYCVKSSLLAQETITMPDLWVLVSQCQSSVKTWRLVDEPIVFFIDQMLDQWRYSQSVPRSPPNRGVINIVPANWDEYAERNKIKSDNPNPNPKCAEQSTNGTPVLYCILSTGLSDQKTSHQLIVWHVKTGVYLIGRASRICCLAHFAMEGRVWWLKMGWLPNKSYLSLNRCYFLLLLPFKVLTVRKTRIMVANLPQS